MRQGSERRVRSNRAMEGTKRLGALYPMVSRLRSGVRESNARSFGHLPQRAAVIPLGLPSGEQCSILPAFRVREGTLQVLWRERWKSLTTVLVLLPRPTGDNGFPALPPESLTQMEQERRPVSDSPPASYPPGPPLSVGTLTRGGGKSSGTTQLGTRHWQRIPQSVPCGTWRRLLQIRPRNPGEHPGGLGGTRQPHDLPTP